ncbi:hypothetical protein [Streptomyces sp. CA-106110]|uniref:hypothetical protein n=1 Tax=Streptomyces sp. CA-106110 TaxID=3240044 RepID=UPI003D8E245E
MANDEGTTPQVIKQELGAWVVEMVWPADAVSGGPREMRIVPSEEATDAEVARGVSTTVLRNIDLSWATTQATSLNPNLPEKDRILAHRRSVSKLYEWRDEGLSERYLAALAMEYVVLSENGIRGPLGEIAELLDKPRNTLKTHLAQARRKGLLETTPGKPGGTVTEKALEIVRRNPD